ncbi:protein-tyrosine sulfotransferase 2-like [Exaiptasia diaphana]|uniref:Protein-tyrosine sulfotransferase n=1 Tax=Exaiptasia diaphana TaxID=2652724 RepID=A0A913YA99_EXADI|nr:protein-tyrosine sulfotransferase 2-like [Exaiptasia diaphana]
MKIIQRTLLLTITFLGSILFVVVKFRCFTSHRKEERLSPIIFVGGFPRSGTTLMRVLLDTHPDIRCGQETHVIPKFLLHLGYINRKREKRRLNEAGVTENVLDSAAASFIFQIIKNHGAPAPILCNKDPLSLRNTTYLSKLFPNAKFVLMVRDVRAVVHSIISRKVVIRGLKNHTYEDLFRKWSYAVEKMDNQCTALGRRKCLSVYYEHLVLFPERTMKAVFDFVGVKWNDRVLHHERLVGKPRGPVVSSLEKSSDQVKEPIYHSSLYGWMDGLPVETWKYLDELAPIMKQMGYDTVSQKPDYQKMAVKL